MTSPDGDRERYLDAVLIGGREQVTIVIAEPDDAWPERFAELKRRVERALSSTALSVEHIGSTSVPGLAAKPIVDMLLTVASVDDEAAYVAALEAAGFVLRVREPGHRLFRTPERDMHLHVYEPGDQAVQDYLDLRDWLRESDRSLYAATKRELAQHELREVSAGNVSASWQCAPHLRRSGSSPRSATRWRRLRRTRRATRGSGPRAPVSS